MIAIDTNLIFYAFHPEAPHHSKSRAAIVAAQRSGLGWGMAAGSVAEFWSLATRTWPGQVRATAAPARAAEFLAGMCQGGARIWQGQQDFAPRLVELAVRLGVNGRRIYDLQIALAAHDNGATEIWTNDGGFATVPGLKAFNPLVTS